MSLQALHIGVQIRHVSLIVLLTPLVGRNTHQGELVFKHKKLMLSVIALRCIIF